MLPDTTSIQDQCVYTRSWQPSKPPFRRNCPECRTTQKSDVGTWWGNVGNALGRYTEGSKLALINCPTAGCAAVKRGEISQF